MPEDRKMANIRKCMEAAQRERERRDKCKKKKTSKR